MSWKTIIFIAMGLVFVIIDQVSKQLAVQQSQITFNTGIAFGLLSGVSWLQLIVFLGVMAWLTNLIFHHQHKYALIFIYFGALSNLIDRYRFGAVVDWLAVPGLPLKNNLADWLIVLSLAWISWVEIKYKFNQAK